MAQQQKPFIAGNWKMNKTIPEAVETVRRLREVLPGLEGARLVVIPPFTALSEVRKAIEGSPVELGAQDVFWEEKGAYTGEVSPLMLKDAGCAYV
ncbi:MAG: triose-phosphate isomerase, partial [Candidatus Aminicenantales bacterium]